MRCDDRRRLRGGPNMNFPTLSAGLITCLMKRDIRNTGGQYPTPSASADRMHVYVLGSMRDKKLTSPSGALEAHTIDFLRHDF